MFVEQLRRGVGGSPRLEPATPKPAQGRAGAPGPGGWVKFGSAHEYKRIRRPGQRSGTGLGLPKGRVGLGLRSGEIRTVHRSKDGVRSLPPNPSLKPR